MIPVTKTYLPNRQVYDKLLDLIWESGQITNGGTCAQRLQEELQRTLCAKGFALVANGTLALQLAIRSLELKGEIITTPYSYVATTNAILWEGCVPVYVDIKPETLCIDPDLIENAITENTSAILATHVYGYPCDVHRIERIAKQYNLKVIYDAAHAFSVKLHDEWLTNFGDCSILSFHATKLFHTVEGGGVVCQDKNLAERIMLLGKFGHIGEDKYMELGINAKMSELHAAMGLAVLPDVHNLISERKKRVELYDQLLCNTSLVRPRLQDGIKHNYAYYPIIFQSHEQMLKARDKLQQCGIIARRYFHPSLNTLPFLDEKLRISCPASEFVSKRVLCLPLYDSLTNEQIQYIVKQLII